MVVNDPPTKIVLPLGRIVKTVADVGFGLKSEIISRTSKPLKDIAS
jgi:hypothetical protein